MRQLIILRAAADPSYVTRMRRRDLVGRVDRVNKLRFFAGLEPVAYPQTKVEARR